MRLVQFLLAGTATVSGGLAESPAQTGALPVASLTSAAALPVPRREFAARLAQSPSLEGPVAWRVIDEEVAWKALAADSDRQGARWAYARSLVGRGRGAEALGVLDVMQQDDPDLRMVDSFRLARGAALTLEQRTEDALAEFDARDDGAPLATPEACAWRMRLLAQAGRGQDALAHVACAWPALQARRATDRKPFLIAAARSGV